MSTAMNTRERSICPRHQNKYIPSVIFDDGARRVTGYRCCLPAVGKRNLKRRGTGLSTRGLYVRSTCRRVAWQEHAVAGQHAVSVLETAA